VAFPLLAAEAGYRPAEIGALVAVSALAQIAMRWLLADVMRRVSNTTVVTAAALSLGVSNALLAASAALVPMLIASLVQGTARACFWTGSQTHIVRRGGRPAPGIARLNLVASVGMMAGPLTGGVLADESVHMALGVAAVIGFAGCILTFLMVRLPPFAAGQTMNRRGFMRRRGVAMGVSANAIAGAWRGIVGSYVPVALEAAGRSGATIGAVVAAANTASVAGSFVSARVSGPHTRAALLWCGALTAATTGVVGYGWLPVLVTAASLSVGGLASGVLQVLGIAAAAQGVADDERGDAVAVTGTLRAVALFASPMGAAALLPVIGMGSAVLVMSLLMFVPVALIRRDAGVPVVVHEVGLGEPAQ